MAKEVKVVNYDNVEIKVTIDGKRKYYEVQEGYRLYPMDIRTVDPADYARKGFIPELITYWQIGESSRLSYMIPIPDEQFCAIIAYDRAEDKRLERQRKCMVPGKSGTLIICRQASCRKAQENGLCPNYGKLDIQVNSTVSLDQMMEDTNWQPATQDITSSEANAHMMEDGFKIFLEQHQPKLRIIYEADAIGLTPAEIAAEYGFNPNTVYRDLQRIRKLAKEYFNQD